MLPKKIQGKKAILTAVADVINMIPASVLEIYYLLVRTYNKTNIM